MVFSTIAFLFQFLPIFLLAYYATPQKYRNITLVIGSLVFYAIGSGWYTLLLLLSLLINYGLSRMISGTVRSTWWIWHFTRTATDCV